MEEKQLDTVDVKVEPTTLPDDPNVLKAEIEKLRKENAEKRIKAKTAEELESKLKEYEIKELERMKKEKDIEEDKLRKTGEYEALLKLKETEKENLNLELQKAVSKLAEYEQKEEALKAEIEKKKLELLEELPKDIREYYSSATLEAIEDRVKVHKNVTAKDTDVKPNKDTNKLPDKPDVDKMTPYEKIKYQLANL